MNQFEQVFTVTLDDDDGPDIHSRQGTYVDLPFLKSGYDWFQYLTVDRTLYKRETANKVSNNYLPQEGYLLDDHINNRMAYIHRPPTDENYALTQRELEIHRHGINKTIKYYLQQFVVYCAVQVGVVYPERQMRTWNDLIDYVERYMKTREDAIKILHALVVSFDYVPDFRMHICGAVMIQYGITIVRKKSDKSRSFCEKIVTHRHNLIRKQLNEASLPVTGYQFRVIRPPRISGQIELEERQPKYFSEWMLEYSPSKIEGKKKQTKNKPKKKNPRRANSSYTTGNKPQTKEDLANELEELNKRREELSAELEAWNNKSSALTVVTENDVEDDIEEEEDNGLATGLDDDDDEEEDVPLPTYVTQTITQCYPGANKQGTPRSSPRLNKRSPLLGQYSEIEEDEKTDDDDVIVVNVKENSPSKNKKSKAARDSPQSLQRSSSKKSSNSSSNKKSSKSTKNDTSDSSDSEEIDSSEDDRKKKKSNRDKGNEKHKRSKKKKNDSSSDSDSDSSDDEQSRSKKHRSNSKERKSSSKKKHNSKGVDDEVLSAIRREIYKDIKDKYKKKRKEDSDSDDDDSDAKKPSKKKVKTSKKKNKKNNSEDSDSGSDEESKRSKKKKSSAKKSKKNKSESDDSSSEESDNDKSSKKKHHEQEKKQKSVVTNKKSVTTKKADAAKLVVETKGKTKPAVTRKPAVARKGRKSSVIVLKEKRDLKEKNCRTITQLFPRTRGNNKNEVVVIDDDEDCVYDIPFYPDLPYEPMDGDTTQKQIMPLHILNLRKGKGWKLEFFVRWSNDCCEWLFVHGIINRLPEETEHFMTTYDLHYMTCGYATDPRLLKRKPRLYCDFEPLESTGLKPIAGASRDYIDYAALTSTIYDKLKLNIRFLSNPFDGSIEIITTPTKRKKDTNFWEDNDDYIAPVSNDVSKVDDNDNIDDISGTSGNENSKEEITITDDNDDINKGEDSIVQNYLTTKEQFNSPSSYGNIHMNAYK